MPTLAESAFSEPALRRAWGEVLSANREDGMPSPGLRRFEEHLDDELGRLVADLAWGAYDPHTLAEVVIDEPGRTRILHVPAVRDRVVERAVLDAITPLIDPLLGPASFAYRPGLGVADAVQALARLRDEGLSWVLRTDVDDCFPSIPVAIARRMLGAVVDDAEELRVARAIVAAKVRKQIIVLQHFSRRAHADAVSESVSAMSNALLLLPDCGTPAEAMGVEGAAAAAYFPALGGLMPDGLKFTHRTRQPPLDVANSALSFLYTVLLGECVSALVAAGLEPVLGVLHADDEGRPSLALDLIEEFRPLIVDQVVLEAARQGRLMAAHGRSDPDRAGVLITQAGKEVLLTAYENRMLRHTRGALPDFAGSMRRHLYRQAQRLQGAICGSVEWTGLSWR